MALIVLTAAGGSPGVTTTALGLTLSWPRGALLVDCDRTPTQAVLAGYLRGAETGQRGLGRVLQAHRERRPVEEVLENETVELPPLTATGPTRRFLPGFPHPGTVGLFGSAWPDLIAAMAAREEEVIIDAGRIGPEGLPAPLAQAADLVLVVTRSSLVALAGLRLYLPGVIEAAGPGRVGLAVVGEGMPYGRAEIESQFSTPVRALIDHAPAAAAVLSDGASPPRRFAEQAFHRSLAKAANELATRLEDVRQLIGAPR